MFYILLAAIFFAYRNATEDTAVFLKNLLLKLTIYSAIGLIMYSITMNKMIQIRNWNDPILAELHYLHFSNPESQTHWKNYNDYIEDQSTHSGYHQRTSEWITLWNSTG